MMTDKYCYDSDGCHPAERPDATPPKEVEKKTWRDRFYEGMHREWALANGWTPPKAARSPEVEPVAWRMKYKGETMTWVLSRLRPQPGDNIEIQSLYASSPEVTEPQFTICPKCAGPLITEMRCDGRCRKVWKIEELQKLLGEG